MTPKPQNFKELLPSAQCLVPSARNQNFVSAGKNLLKNRK